MSEREIGVIIRLQAQCANLKGKNGRREYYDPAGIVALPALRLEECGVIGLDAQGGAVLDLHHPAHPASKNRAGLNGVSFGLTTHYAAMRARFGPHLSDGIAGENILIDLINPGAFGGILSEGDLNAGLIIRAADGRSIHLERIMVAEPCTPFTRFALRHPPDAPSDRSISAALTFLRAGMRGFYASYNGPPALLHLGDRVFLPR